MFIRVKDANDETCLVNVDQVKAIVSRKIKGGEGSFIDFGGNLYLRSNSSPGEIEKLIKEGEQSGQ